MRLRHTLQVVFDYNFLNKAVPFRLPQSFQRVFMLRVEAGISASKIFEVKRKEQQEEMNLVP